MMIAPLRGVMAMPLVPCDMDNASMANVGAGEHEGSMNVGHMMKHDMSANMPANMKHVVTTDEDAAVSHKCCCCDDINNSCNNHRCHTGSSVSLLFHTPSYLPNFTHASATVTMDVRPVSIEFTPPFRPPLSFYS